MDVKRMASPGRYEIHHPDTLMSDEQRAWEMWAVHPSDLERLGMTREEFFLSHIRAAKQKRVEDCHAWYAVRHARIRDLAKEHGIWPEVAAIMANGTTTGADGYDPPTYAQMLNAAIHRAERAEAELAKLRNEGD